MCARISLSDCGLEKGFRHTLILCSLNSSPKTLKEGGLVCLELSNSKASCLIMFPHLHELKNFEAL